MENINTLWSILEQFGIEIPPIQRDFAQGRETEEANKIRIKFLNSIFNALEKNEKLPLDFVYGKIYGFKNEEEHRRNKNAIQSLINSVKDYALTIDLTLKDSTVEDKSSERSNVVYLIPLDGQQRLTTLFLIHWYIAKRLKMKKEISILNRFRYKTRKSSTSFLKLLTDEQLSLQFNIDLNNKTHDLKTQKLYSEIINLEFFSSSWLNDPTVKAMLIMIQEVHNRLQSHNDDQLKDYWYKLIEKKLLWFDFLDLKDFNLSDELYVKMNARGKQLSSFENFKGWLFALLNDSDIIESTIWESYSIKFDIEWNDIFWKQKEEGVYDIDSIYFNFFKILFLFDNVKNANLNTTNFDKNTKEYTVIDTVINNKSFNWENLCDKNFETNLESYLQILVFCEEFTTEDNHINDFFSFLFSSKGIKPSWQNLIKNYITLSFIKYKEKALNKYLEEDFEQLKEYHRILFNLFDNTIIDNPSLYVNAVNEIDQLNINLKKLDYSITEWVESLEYSTKSVFTEQQILEEILKYRLSANEDWKLLILEAENVIYFERQLNFWFYRAGISLKKEDFNIDLLNDTKSKEKFKNTTAKINKLFNEKEINRKTDFSERIFERALLSKSDYLLSEKGYKCFGRNLGRDVSWKRLFFRDRNSSQTNQALLEVFDLDFLNVKESFKSYIDKNISENPIEKWRKTFVLNKELFEYLGDLKYIRNIDNHGWVIIKDSYKTYIGAHYELFSLDFYLNQLKDNNLYPFNKIDYYPAPKNNIDDFPCAYLDWKTDTFNYALDIKFIYSKFCLIFHIRNGKINDEILESLTTLGYEKKLDYYYKDLPSSELAFNDIIELTKKLNQ